MEARNKFYAVTVEILTEDDNGKVKKKKEIHLVDAVDLTDVQRKVTDAMANEMYEWSIKKTVVSDICTVYGDCVGE